MKKIQLVALTVLFCSLLSIAVFPVDAYYNCTNPPASSCLVPLGSSCRQDGGSDKNQLEADLVDWVDGHCYPNTAVVYCIEIFVIGPVYIGKIWFKCE